MRVASVLGGWHSRCTRRFLRHLLKMTIAMMLGMCILGAAFGGLFETSEQGDESTKVVAKWITDENLNTAIPNAPKITSGKVVVQSDRVLAVA